MNDSHWSTGIEIEVLKCDRSHLIDAAQALVNVIDKMAPILQGTVEYVYAKHVLENINDTRQEICKEDYKEEVSQ